MSSGVAINAIKSLPVVVVKSAGGSGLGDLLLTVLTALTYCGIAGRNLYVDWTDGRLGRKGENVFPRLFEMTGDVCNLARLGAHNGTSDIAPVAWRGRLDKSLHEVYVDDGNREWDRAATVARYSFDLGKIDYEEAVLVMWEFTQFDRLLGFLPPQVGAMDRDSRFRWVRERNIRITAELEQEARSCMATDCKTVGVHVRLTDEAARQKGSVALKSYFRLVDGLVKQGDADVVVLATDNRNVEDAFRDRYKNIITRSKWYPPPGNAIHLDRNCPNRWASTRDALVEARMLSLCEHLITQSNSSFSAMARIFYDGDRRKLITLETRQPWLKRFQHIAGGVV